MVRRTFLNTGLTAKNERTRTILLNPEPKIRPRTDKIDLEKFDVRTAHGLYENKIPCVESCRTQSDFLDNDKSKKVERDVWTESNQSVKKRSNSC